MYILLTHRARRAWWMISCKTTMALVVHCLIKCGGGYHGHPRSPTPAQTRVAPQPEQGEGGKDGPSPAHALQRY